MKIAVHSTSNLNPYSFAPNWIKVLKSNNIEVLELDFYNTDIIKKVRQCDGVMWNWFHTPEDKQATNFILNPIEHELKIPVFPNYQTRWHFDEKVAQHYFFDAIDAPKVKSWVFRNKHEALEFIKFADYPLITKLSVGAGSANVFLLNNQEEAANFVKRIFNIGIYPYTLNEFSRDNILKSWSNFTRFINDLRNIKNIIFNNYSHVLPKHFQVQKNYVYFQEYVKNNLYDIRITVIGNRIFGFTRENRKNDFRASGSGNINYDVEKIPKEALKIAYDISKKCNFQSMAYDFLLKDGKTVLLNEISYTYVSNAVANSKGYWNENLEWVNKTITPEKAQVIDFINQINSNKNK